MYLGYDPPVHKQIIWSDYKHFMGGLRVIKWLYVDQVDIKQIG